MRSRSAIWLSMVWLALLAMPAAAEEDSVYESLAGVSIGRVFLSQQQRDALDERRKHGVPTVAAAPGDTAAEVEPGRAVSSAGYIIGRDGHSKVWRDGDFVTHANAKSASFPGDIKIIRHAAAVLVAAPAEPDTADDD